MTLAVMHIPCWLIKVGRTESGNVKKGKAIPVTDHGDPYGYEMLELQHSSQQQAHICPLPPGRFLILISVRGG
jgi:hypothetical protein